MDTDRSGEERDGYRQYREEIDGFRQIERREKWIQTDREKRGMDTDRQREEKDGYRKIERR